jgi:hypothetical protein
MSQSNSLCVSELPAKESIRRRPLRARDAPATVATHMRHRRYIAAIAAAGLLSACGGGPTGPRPSARLEASASPSPINPIECPLSSCGSLLNQLEAASTLTIRETAGVAGIVESVSLVMRRSSDGAVVANATPSVGTRFSAGGSLALPVAVHWDRGQMTTDGSLAVMVNARDDNSHAVTVSLTIPVTAVPDQRQQASGMSSSRAIRCDHRVRPCGKRWAGAEIGTVKALLTESRDRFCGSRASALVCSGS